MNNDEMDEINRIIFLLNLNYKEKLNKSEHETLKDFFIKYLDIKHELESNKINKEEYSYKFNNLQKELSAYIEMKKNNVQLH